MSGAAPRRSSPAEPTGAGRSDEQRRPPRWQDRWLRLRIILFFAALLVMVSVLLDVVLVYVLPLPPATAGYARSDVLLYSPAALAVLILVVLVELRPVSGALQTLRLGLRLPSVERQRALRTALSFPVVLPSAVLLIGTAGNLVSLGLDMFGRTPWLWHAVHATVVTQCVIVAASFPAFVYLRAVLRPSVIALGGQQVIAPGGVGLRGRVVVLLVTLAALILLPSGSYLLLQLEHRTSAQRERTMRELSESMAREAHQMGLHSFTDYVRSSFSGGDGYVFVVDARGGVAPQAAAPLVRRARLPPPREGRYPVVRVRPDRHVVVTAVRLAGREYAWVGVAFSPRVVPQARGALLALILCVLGVALLLALVIGAGVARELRALAGRLQALTEGHAPEPLPADVGAISEIGKVIDGINALLAATDLAKLRGFVEIEQAEEAARSKTEFLANMSHDLRAPLTATIGFADFLAQGVSGILTPEQRSAVGRILDGALTLQHTITVLLDTAKLEAGRLRLHRSWTPPATLVSRAVKEFTRRPGATGTRRVKVEVEPGLPPVHVDPDRAAEALALLLGALRGDRADAQLYLRVRMVRTGMDSGVELEVGDRGGKPLSPPGEAYFSDVISEGNARGLRLEPHLAAELLRRQRGRVELLEGRNDAVGFRVTIPLALTGEMPALRGG